jgi:anaphase-promoting complex subunit 5
MPRFFTPARVCLLVLIRLYQSDCSSNSSLDLLDFIARHTLLTSTQDAGVGILQDRQLLFSSDITALASTLQQWSTVQPGRNVYDVFLHTVWTELHGLDSLHELVTASKESTMVGVNSTASYKTPFTPSSPIGQFVRRCYVEFTRLQFSDLEALWLAFTTYRAPSYEKWAAKNPDAAELAKEEVASNAVGGASSEPTSRSTVPASTASAVDTEILLGYAIHQLQRLGTRVPLDVKSRLESWISEQQESGTQSNHFFMAFFEYWRAGQYTMALESLHRFFDYSLAAKTGSSDNMKVYYQYALLHLSVLHADFECWEESIDAMNECIATGELAYNHLLLSLKLTCDSAREPRLCLFELCTLLAALPPSCTSW